jgi:hypothetical protein
MLLVPSQCFQTSMKVHQRAIDFARFLKSDAGGTGFSTALTPGQIDNRNLFIEVSQFCMDYIVVVVFIYTITIVIGVLIHIPCSIAASDQHCGTNARRRHNDSDWNRCCIWFQPLADSAARTLTSSWHPRRTESHVLPNLSRVHGHLFLVGRGKDD